MYHIRLLFYYLDSIKLTLDNTILQKLNYTNLSITPNCHISRQLWVTFEDSRSELRYHRLLLIDSSRGTRLWVGSGVMRWIGKYLLSYNWSWYFGNYVEGLGKTTIQITLVFNMWYIRTKHFHHNSETLTLEFIYGATGFSGKLTVEHGLKYSSRFHWVIMNKTLLHINLLPYVFKPPTIVRCSW